jgi:hypothetical protein
VVGQGSTREAQLPASRRFLLPLIAAIAAAALLVPASGSAAAGTKVIVSFKLPAFHGKLASSSQGCVANRTVRLFKVRSGPDRVLKTDRSNAKGKWAAVIARKRVPSGTYYAKVAARGTCKAGTSKRLAIP